MDKFLANFDFVVVNGNAHSIIIPSQKNTSTYGFCFEANVASYTIVSDYHFKVVRNLINLVFQHQGYVIS